MSIARSDHLRPLAAVLALLLAGWIAVCGSLELLARTVERDLGAHLWVREEWMQLFTPTTYERGAADRIHVIGASEAREAFWSEPFEQTLGSELLNDSISMSTLEDGITQLEYLVATYGPEVIPERLLLAVTPRYLLGHIPGRHSLQIAMDRYSPTFRLDERVEPQRLDPKGRAAAFLARVRLVGHQGARYRRTLTALRIAIRQRLQGGDLDTMLREHHLVPSRYHWYDPHDKASYYARASDGTGLYAKVGQMDVRQRRDEIVGRFRQLRDQCTQLGIRLYVVNMPEGGWMRRGFYAPGIYEGYREVLEDAIAGVPLLDLRDAVSDDGFFDWSHVTFPGGLEVSRRVAEWIRRLDAEQAQTPSHVE